MNRDWLWSDGCFLGVLLVSLLFIVLGCRKSHHRLAFKRLFEKPVAMGALVLLLFFLVIAVLDSIPSVRQASKDTADIRHVTLLDKILAPLGAVDEKTYSAPLALHAYVSETLWAKGVAEQIYPVLAYPAAHFKSKKDVKAFCFKMLEKGFLDSFIFVFGLASMVWGGRFMLGHGKSFVPNAPFFTTLVTLFLGLAVVLVFYNISRELHVLGTGKIGQDIFYHAVKSIRTGLVIGILTTVFMMPLALLFGVASGYWGGRVDDVVQYVYTTLSSIPGVLLITASVLSIQTYLANHPERFSSLSDDADARLLALCFILGITSWTTLCRLIRAEVLKLREMDFVLAGKALGTSDLKIMTKHLLPNVMHLVLVTMVLDFSFLVLAEALLAYVGVGVSPMTISWGNMINAARLELSREPVVWWPILAAFGFMFMLVLSSNIFADAVRDAFDPRQEA
ncbi:MAG: ABC transporter permease [Gammaproteobacteria bacterium]|nr:ABC transporter permease [Gammaproteobacteria bacterium]